MPFDELADKAVSCTPSEVKVDLGVTTNYSCLAAFDLGIEYGWYKGTNYGVWRGDGDKRCLVCELAGNASTWTFEDAPGAWSYVLQQSGARERIEKFIREFDADGDGRLDPHDFRATQNVEPDDEEDGEEDEREEAARKVSGGGNVYIIKNFAFGAGNWTWSRLPEHLQYIGLQGFTTSDEGRTLYAIGQGCIARSFDQGDTWTECWEAPGAGVSGLFAKDATTLIALRSGDVPVRTTDGGATWQPMASLAAVAKAVRQFVWSWTGKTLIMVGNGGEQSAAHPHSMYIWRSTDDGDSWTDETADLVTSNAGMSQWYEGTVFLGSSGQGILSKQMEF